MTTLHFERDDEDELRKAGMSKEHGPGPSPREPERASCPAAAKAWAEGAGTSGQQAILDLSPARLLRLRPSCRPPYLSSLHYELEKPVALRPRYLRIG